METTGEGAERVAALGRLTVCYTIGSIIGPALGGALGASGDYYFGAQLAVVGSILSIILCLFMSHPNKPGDSGGTTDAGALKGAADAFPYSVINVIKAVWILLGSKLISGVANSIHAGVLPLIYKNEFGLNEKGLVRYCRPLS